MRFMPPCVVKSRCCLGPTRTMDFPNDGFGGLTTIIPSSIQVACSLRQLMSAPIHVEGATAKSDIQQIHVFPRFFVRDAQARSMPVLSLFPQALSGLCQRT